MRQPTLFQVYTSIALRMDTIYVQQSLDALRLLNTVRHHCSTRVPRLTCLCSIPTKHQYRMLLMMVIVSQIPFCHRSHWLQKYFSAATTLSLTSHLSLCGTSKQDSPYWAPGESVKHQWRCISCITKRSSLDTIIVDTS